MVRNGAKTTRRSERGASSVEYAMLIALIAFVIFGTVVALGGAVSDLFDTARDLF